MMAMVGNCAGDDIDPLINDRWGAAALLRNRKENGEGVRHPIFMHLNFLIIPRMIIIIIIAITTTTSAAQPTNRKDIGGEFVPPDVYEYEREIKTWLRIENKHHQYSFENENQHDEPASHRVQRLRTRSFQASGIEREIEKERERERDFRLSFLRAVELSVIQKAFVVIRCLSDILWENIFREHCRSRIIITIINIISCGVGSAYRDTGGVIAQFRSADAQAEAFDCVVVAPSKTSVASI